MNSLSSGQIEDQVDFSTPGILVRSIFDPAKTGRTTGETMSFAGRRYARLRLKSGEISQVPCEQLERVPEVETRLDAVAALRLSGPEHLHRAILTEKVKGRLTDVFYSMGTGDAEFYPHQFKPVLKLVSSTSGRILIADEVGLGKTIEAIYVWKELQARFGSRRLLVVCPSMLQQKWQNELRNRFSIDANIVDANELLQQLERVTEDATTSFVSIGSIESLRARRPRPEDTERPVGPRQRLAAFLAERESSDETELIDLVIIDEAHYLRNPATAANYLATLLASASSHLVLLTATPIQIGSENLFQLLTLLDADRYANLDVFNAMRRANAPITEALNAVMRMPADPVRFQNAVQEALTSPFFSQDQALRQLASETTDLRQPSDRTRVARVLEGRSLLNDVLTRTRKRDVIQNRVIRNASVVRIALSPAERQVYETIKDSLRAQALHSASAQTLMIIGRLRQLASSIPAAIIGWNENDTLSELLWEDLGIVSDEESQTDLSLGRAVPEASASLEREDTKYKELLKLVKQRVAQDAREKIIIFSFYRGTIKYLERRLRADQLSCAVIMGGMGPEKDAELKRFADANGPSILISSEVGSEGIDLQFARVLINYDLPWNPMKVEQRIGRIDRLGQASDRIHVISFVAKDTIEEIILDRLFQRLDIFRESIGDLEEVFGETFDELLLEYLRDGMSDEDLAKRLEQNAIAAEAHRLDIARLEEDAPELVGHTGFILSNIQESRDEGRWISPSDIVEFITDILDEFFVGSRVERHPTKHDLFDISLSIDARASLAAFIESTRPARATRLHAPGQSVAVVFDIAHQVDRRPKPELIDLTHPLVLWLRSEIDRRDAKSAPAVAIELPEQSTDASAGLYVFAADFWRFEGLHRQVVIRNAVIATHDLSLLEQDAAERLILNAARFGKKVDMFPYAEMVDALRESLAHCEQSLLKQFSADAHFFQLENEQRVRQAELIAEERAKKKLKMLKERLHSQRTSTDERRRRAAQLTDGQIKRLIADRDQRLARIALARNAETASRPVSGGIILVR
ncbi:SNF2-related protein [Bradyrhizobium sp. Mp27]|uniref:SNF2-related protein n=1 Tax=Bradyrhizobium sp. Mp27 TaxID=3042157 RepID=UPI00248C8BDD|nr:SNF2-related protein [Bradyrhizobium sp. Mp27]MDI2073065.1 SNF2-related protein [Bradyrhizobium sp. Mp27]